MLRVRENRVRALCIVTLVVTTLIPVCATAITLKAKTNDRPEINNGKADAIKRRIAIIQRRINATLKALEKKNAPATKSRGGKKRKYVKRK